MREPRAFDRFRARKFVKYRRWSKHVLALALLVTWATKSVAGIASRDWPNDHDDVFIGIHYFFVHGNHRALRY